MPVKVYELAKELKKTNTEMVGMLGTRFGLRVGPTSDLDEATVERIREGLAQSGTNGTNANGSAPTAPPANGNGANVSARPVPAASARPAAPPATTRPATPTAQPAPSGEAIEVPANITIRELGERLGVGAGAVQKVLVDMGVLAGLNQRLAPDAVQRIAGKLGRTVRTAGSAPAAPANPATPEKTNGAAVPAAQAGTSAPTAPTAEQIRIDAPEQTSTPATTPTAKAPLAKPTAQTAAANKTKSLAVKGRAQGDLIARPPVVTIMGHVDHGKTTLLDTIRKADVAGGEAGGITQHIGAYQVEHGGQRITFLDTPGHAAFSAMRARGAKVTDIIVVVVAADDSVMPQTEEALNLAKESGLPLIVAVNKVDLPDADPDRVLTDLTRYEIVPEAYGGDVQTVNISAKKGDGISDLLDVILLVSEAVVDPKADPHGKAQGTIIEAKLEKGRGAVATVLVQQGTLTMGDVVVAGTFFGKIRTMSDERGNRLQKAGPSTPVEIVGLNGVPDAGDQMEVAKDDRAARALSAEREQSQRSERLGTITSRVSLETLYRQLRQGVTKELNLVIKGDVQGSVQAVRDSVKDLGNDEVRVRVLSAQVGPVSDNDVLLAASDKDASAQNSLVIGFNVGVASPAVEKKAEQEHVTIKTYGIIYELIDAVKEQLVGLMEPIFEEATIGHAEVRQLFKLPGSRKIAGSYVTDGIVRRNAKARVFRGKDQLFTGDIDTLRRFKDDAREVASGYECGITLRDFNDLQAGDTIECFEVRQVPREL